MNNTCKNAIWSLSFPFSLVAPIMAQAQAQAQPQAVGNIVQLSGEGQSGLGKHSGVDDARSDHDRGRTAEESIQSKQNMRGRHSQKGGDSHKVDGAESVGSTNSENRGVEDIVVTGRGLPDTPAQTVYSSFDLDRSAIISSSSGRIEDVLSGVAGFQQFRRSDSRSSNPSAQGVTLRALGGNATSRALVLLDGVPIADPFFGYIPLSAINPDMLSTIRITRGGGSGPFGSGALAGTIALESIDATSARLGEGDAHLMKLSALVNDRGGSEISGVMASPLGAGFALVNGRWDRGKGFFTAPADQRVPASVRAKFDSWSMGARALAPLSGSVELQARGQLFSDQRTLRFDGADSASKGADASVRLVGRGDWQFDAIGFLQARDFSNIVISSTRFVRVLDQRKTPSTGLGGKLELRPPMAEGKVLRFGADYRQTSGELQEENYSAFSGALRERRRAGGRNSDLGLYIEGDVTLGTLKVTGGLRGDRTIIANGFYRASDAGGRLLRETLHQTRKAWSLGWRGGATWQVDDRLRLRASAYRGHRLPTLNELYRPFVIFPVVTQANALLENEQMRGFELGADFVDGDDFGLSITAFDNRVENAIANVTLTPTLRERQNLPAIKARGVEVNGFVDSGGFSLTGSMAYVDARVEGRGDSLALDGNQPPQTPDFSASLTAAYRTQDGWNMSFTLRHVARQYESDSETGILPAATTLGFLAQMPLGGGFSAILRGENLMDETIVTRNSGGALDIGVPRTLWAGVRYGF